MTGGTWYAEAKHLGRWCPQLTKYDPTGHSSVKAGHVKIRNAFPVPDGLSIMQAQLWLVKEGKIESIGMASVDGDENAAPA